MGRTPDEEAADALFEKLSKIVENEPPSDDDYYEYFGSDLASED